MIKKNEWLSTKEPLEDPSPEYKILGDPDESHREAAWRIAIGLQDVDNLKVSDYLIDVANKNIVGEITSLEAKNIVDEYVVRQQKYNVDKRTIEADMVASRINQLLQSNGYTFSVGQYLSIHYHLFNGIYKFAGQFRNFEISKSEWVLDGESVKYGSALNLRDTIKYDIEEEKNFDFNVIDENEFIKHIAKFCANLWQIHVFEEGNTRVTAVFLIKYLQKLGFDYVNNNMFDKHSWYFRNSLVRANYDNDVKGIRSTTYYLEMFLRNIILGECNELHNRDIHVNNVLLAKEYKVKPSASNELTMYEMKVLDQLRKNPELKQADIAKKIGRSLRTVKTLTKSLSNKGAIKRVNGKRYGYWVIEI